MQAFSKFNRGVRYLVTVIDVFSKYGWMLPLKDKSGKSVADAFKEIFKKSKWKPEKLWTDKGREFYNKHVKELGVELYSNESEEKSSVVERWNRTMKDKMCKYFTANNASKYIDVLNEFVSKYNNTRHSSIKMTPVEASKKENEVRAYRNLSLKDERYIQNSKLVTKSDFSRRKDSLRKGSPQTGQKKCSLFQNSKNQPSYKITDHNGKEIHGTFYEQKLQTTSQEVFSIEKLVKKGKTRSLVKWRGYPEIFNSWVDNKELIKLWYKWIKVLESKDQQSLRFWTTNSHQSKLKNCKNYEPWSKTVQKSIHLSRLI